MRIRNGMEARSVVPPTLGREEGLRKWRKGKWCGTAPEIGARDTPHVGPRRVRRGVLAEKASNQRRPRLAASRAKRLPVRASDHLLPLWFSNPSHFLPFAPAL